jgi:hypothetical protein
MSTSVKVLFGILVVLGYVVAPASLAWGWARWALQPKSRTVASILSLTGFVFATASAMLALATAAYAQVHKFAYYDPLLLRILGWGTLLSLAATFFAICGLWRKSSLRWYAPVSALATLAFWIMAASGE